MVPSCTTCVCFRCDFVLITLKDCRELLGETRDMFPREARLEPCLRDILFHDDCILTELPPIKMLVLPTTLSFAFLIRSACRLSMKACGTASFSKKLAFLITS